eukprot:8624387-Alexandrium_andersonii.AAC.1
MCIRDRCEQAPELLLFTAQAPFDAVQEEPAEEEPPASEPGFSGEDEVLLQPKIAPTASEFTSHAEDAEVDPYQAAGGDDAGGQDPRLNSGGYPLLHGQAKLPRAVGGELVANAAKVLIEH